MKNTKTVAGLIFASIITCIMLFTTTAKATLDSKKQPVAMNCDSSDGTILMIGNSCSGSGNGCIPNPCE